MTVVNNSLEGMINPNLFMSEQKFTEIQKTGDSPVIKQNKSPLKLHLDLRDSAKFSSQISTPGKSPYTKKSDPQKILGSVE